MNLRWVTNGPTSPHAHVDPPSYSLLEWAEITVEKRRVRIPCCCVLIGCVEGPPKASSNYTEEQLRSFGMTGYYQESRSNV